VRSSFAGRIATRALLVLLIGPSIAILVFRVMPVPITPLMVVRLVQGYGLKHHWVPYDRVAPSLVQAVIASEDNLFCRERLGFDGDALREQIDSWWHGERPRGASTITMQTVRNLLLWPGRDIVRKVIEAWFTPQLALLWPKSRILEVYLNIVEFGPGVYGAEAAAEQYFHRHAADLTIEQATLLSVILPAPLEWSPVNPGSYVLRRTEMIRTRVEEIAPLLNCSR
jgi:monofunctional biosynthetic peptidoglycan transglycosylase